MKHMHMKDVESYEASAFGFKGADKWTLKLLSDNSILNELGPAGYTPAEHEHALSGKGVILHGGNKIEIQPNDFFEIAEGNHQYINTGNEPLVFMCFRFPR